MTTATATWADRALGLIRNSWTLPDGTLLGAVLDRDPWIEQDVLRPAFAQREDGLPLHKGLWLEMPRGYGKSFYASAIACAEVLAQPNTHVFLIASDGEQAQLITESLAAQCLRNRRLAGAFKAGKTLFRVPSNNSFIRVMSSDLSSFFGLGGTARRVRIICDELTHWPDAGEGLYDAAWTTLGKVPDSQIILRGQRRHLEQLAVRAQATPR